MNDQVTIMPRHTILVVDDETSIREMLVISLESAGYNVLQAENAKTAHSLVLDKHPDLILLDWMMPVTTGLELLRRLKRDEMTDHIPVIMLTAKAEESSKISGLDSGADDYIAKPFSPRELLSRVKLKKPYIFVVVPLSVLLSKTDALPSGGCHLFHRSCREE